MLAPLLSLLLAQGAPITPPVLQHQVTPAYPAQAEGLAGTVVVLVQVDAQGQVVDAQVQSGPPVFHAAALQAARALRFDPATQEGVAVLVSLPVSFHFAPPHAEHSHEAVMVVEAEAPEPVGTVPTVVLDQADLERSRGQDLARTLSQIPGVESAQGGADSAKPIIRGQSERRMLLLVDGVPHASQKWGADHAPEIDPFSAGQVRVIKGAAGVRYGPDAIGGVVLLEPPALRDMVGTVGHVDLVGVGNGRQLYGGARLDGQLRAAPSWAWRVQGNLRDSADLVTPSYVLGNTASRVWNLGASAGWSHGETALRVSLSHYSQSAGVFYGVRGQDLSASAALAEPVGAQSWKQDRVMDRPMQVVSHDQALLRWDQGLRLGSLETTAAMQLNHRQEFDQVRENVQGPQFDFLLQTWSLQSVWLQPERQLGSWEWGGLVGASGMVQANAYKGLPLLPNYASRGAGVFVMQTLGGQRLHLEAGLRGDIKARTAYLTELAYRRADQRGTLDGVDCTLSDALGQCDSQWAGLSASVGALWHAVPDVLDARLDLSRASRFPSPDEQFMNGQAPSMPVYALGDPALSLERAWSANSSVGLDLGWVHAEVSPYASLIQDYIYFAPELGDQGVQFEVTVAGSFPRYSYRPIDARFVGVDGQVALQPWAHAGATLSAAAVRAQDLESAHSLVGLPGDSLRLQLHWEPQVDALRELRVSVQGSAVARARVDPGLDLAPPPDGYQLLSASASALMPSQRRDVRLALSGQNLLNTSYRDATGLIRYYADSPGRSIKIRLGADF